MRLKSPVPQAVQAPIKENIKAPRHWPLCGEFPGDAENVSVWWRHHDTGVFSYHIISRGMTSSTSMSFENIWWHVDIRRPFNGNSCTTDIFVLRRPSGLSKYGASNRNLWKKNQWTQASNLQTLVSICLHVIISQILKRTHISTLDCQKMNLNKKRAVKSVMQKFDTVLFFWLDSWIPTPSYQWTRWRSTITMTS